ncbi:MAG TPA: PKD domain-containing protein [Dehalococcoidia bacterium]|nr:PKD domain-containing protein [Dehalococcoidia bacterium]
MSLTRGKLWHIATVIFVVLSMLLVFQVGSASASTPIAHKVTDVSNVAFVVSWVTAAVETGQVEYSDDPADLPGGGTTVEDARGAGFTDDTHYVIVSGLTPGTIYYYDIISGGVRYDNNGNHYTVTTGPTIGVPPPFYTVLGKAFKSDGTTPAEGTIVYISVVDNDGLGSSGTSQEMSALVDANGDWSKVINTIREADLSAWFKFDTTGGGDNLSLVAEGSGDGRTSLTVTTTESPRDAGSLVLQANVQNVTATQRADTGIVDISYDLTFAGPTTDTISLEYWDGTDWVGCTTVGGDVGAGIATGTGLTATWDAKTDFDGQYLTSQIRVIGAALGSGESGTFTLDTAVPTGVSQVSPADGATDIAVSPTLEATATDPSGPVYYFEIAEDDAYTVNLQSSGWVGATWAPPTPLSANTLHYWRVKAKDAYGNESAFTADWTFTTVAFPAPVADFSADRTTALTGVAINFTDLSTQGGGGVISAWEWDFNNDGVIDSTVQNPSYTYIVPGTYTVSLTVTGSGALTDSETKIDYIRAIPKEIIMPVAPVVVAPPPQVPTPVRMLPGSGMVPMIGGQVATPERSVVVDFPRGAVPAGTRVNIRPVDVGTIPALPTGFLVGSRAFTIESTAPLTQPVTITYTFNADDLALAGGDASLLALARFDGSRWIVMPTVVDTEYFTLTCQTDQLSTWAVVVNLKLPTTGQGLSLWVVMLIALAGLAALGSGLALRRRHTG